MIGFSPTGYVAVTHQLRDGKHEFEYYPVVSFNAEGAAMICAPNGLLYRAIDAPGFYKVQPIEQLWVGGGVFTG